MSLRKFILIVFILIIALAGTIALGQDNARNLTTEEALAAADVPSRNLTELAERFQGVTNVPEPPTHPIRSYQIGDVDTFRVHNDDEVLEIQATLVYINDVLYMWVENGYELDPDDLQLAANRFANEIYQPVRNVFGSEWSPGIDGDPHLHILHTANLGYGIAGYYYAESEYSQVAVPNSNEREMFFVDIFMLSRGVDYYLSILAHEFQHMIHWAVDANEPSWMNEGLAELSAYIAGFGEGNFADVFLDNPETQLNTWPEGDTTPHYGGGFLFTAYIYERFGIEAIRSLVANPVNGMASVQDMLNEIGAVDTITGEAMTAEALFVDWTITNLLNGTVDAVYTYQDEQLLTLGQADVTHYVNQLPFNESGVSVNQWGSRYYEISGNGQPIRISFSGNETIQVVPANAYSGQYAYWSNRVDSSDARLTREFDLTTVSHATLTFNTWFDIEEGWDYGYVVVSTDGGATWNILTTELSTDFNPHGTSYGFGYTGQLGEWVAQTTDLSAYTGQKILLRFEYITDDATLRNGMLLDDVAIPEIGYFTDFEQPDESWNAEGWVRMDNVLRQSFAVHAVIRHEDGSIEVQRLLFKEDAPHGAWEINGREVILVVSGLAPVTTQPATFDLKIES